MLFWLPLLLKGLKLVYKYWTLYLDSKAIDSTFSVRNDCCPFCRESIPPLSPSIDPPTSISPEDYAKKIERLERIAKWSTLVNMFDKLEKDKVTPDKIDKIDERELVKEVEEAVEEEKEEVEKEKERKKGLSWKKGLGKGFKGMKRAATDGTLKTGLELAREVGDVVGKKK